MQMQAVVTELKLKVTKSDQTYMQYMGIVDHLVEQGWTKAVLFAQNNPST
jgi:hypothetical protein